MRLSLILLCIGIFCKNSIIYIDTGTECKLANNSRNNPADETYLCKTCHTIILYVLEFFDSKYCKNG